LLESFYLKYSFEEEEKIRKDKSKLFLRGFRYSKLSKSHTERKYTVISKLCISFIFGGGVDFIYYLVLFFLKYGLKGIDD
jgi:hypothetical protein